MSRSGEQARRPTAPSGLAARLRTVLVRLQRADLPVPAVLRTRVGRLLRRLQSSAPAEALLEVDWTRPLVERASGAEAVDRSSVWVPTAPVAALTGTATRSPSRTGTSLKCLLVTGSLDVGGMDEVVAFLARRLPAAGLEVAVLHAPPAPAEPGRLARALTDEGVLVVDGRPDTTPAWLETWLPDVISAHGAAPWVLPSARRLGVPYVDTFHGMHDLFGIDWTAEASRSAELDAVVTVSELIRTQYVTGNPSMDPSRVVSIPNAVDDHRHRPADRGAARRALGLQDEFLWVCLARYALQKNTYGLLRAFDRVARQLPEAHLVVAGRGDEPVYVQQVVNLQRRLESADRVHLRDHCPAPAVLLAAADGFVLDSFFEGWALSSMEALFAGLPVVVSEVGGAHEQVGADGSRGRVVRNPAGPPDAVDWPRMRELRYAVQPNESELVEAMVQITRAAPYWASRRAALQAESAARFDADDCVDRHAEVLRAVVHRSRRTGVPTTPGGGE